MTKEQIGEMLFVLADMITAVNEGGTKFVEIPTYLRNHVPGIEPEYIECIRDILGPLYVNKKKEAKIHKEYTSELQQIELKINSLLNNEKYSNYEKLLHIMVEIIFPLYDK